MAFVEYADVRCATQAMAALQGSFIRYTERGGIRIEYAKTKMAEVNQVNGPNSILLTTANVTMNGHHHHPQYSHVNHVNNLNAMTSSSSSSSITAATAAAMTSHPPVPNPLLYRHIVNAA